MEECVCKLKGGLTSKHGGRAFCHAQGGRRKSVTICMGTAALELYKLSHCAFGCANERGGVLAFWRPSQSPRKDRTSRHVIRRLRIEHMNEWTIYELDSRDGENMTLVGINREIS